MTAEQVFVIIRVSAYWTEALPKDLLRKKLHEAVTTARAMIGERESGVGNLTGSFQIYLILLAYRTR